MVDLVLREVKGSPLTHEELDDNFKNIDAAVEARPLNDGTGAEGQWGIDIDGDADNVRGIVSVDHGGTGATNPADALTNLGAYPASNPAGFVSASDNMLSMLYASETTVGLTTTNTIPNQLVDSVSASKFRSVKYLVQVSSGLAYQVSELLLIHDGTNVSLVEYANVSTGAVLASFDAVIVNNVLQLLVSPTNSSATVHAIRKAITA